MPKKLQWPRELPRPQVDATNEQLWKHIDKLMQRFALLKIKIKKVKGERREVKEVIKTQFHVDHIRFTRAPARYYWGALSFLPLKNFLSQKDISIYQFQILMLCKYHSYLILEDLQRWCIPQGARHLTNLTKKGLIQKTRGRWQLNIYTPTDNGRQIIEEYCTMIGKFINLQLRIKKNIDNEKAELRKTDRRRKEVRGVLRGEGNTQTSISAG